MHGVTCKKGLEEGAGGDREREKHATEVSVRSISLSTPETCQLLQGFPLVQPP